MMHTLIMKTTRSSKKVSKSVKSWEWYCANPDKWIECPECGCPDEAGQHAGMCSRHVPTQLTRVGSGLDKIKPNPLAGILLSWPDVDRSELGFDH